MQSRKQTELEWLEDPFGELLRLAWPIAVSTLSYSIMTLIDTLFVGQISPAALAGVGLGGTAAFTILCFSMGLLRGVKVLVSQAKGAGKSTAVQQAYLLAGLWLAAGLGLLSLALGHGLAPILSWISASNEAGIFAADYLRVRMLGSIPFLAAVALREALTGWGDARTPMHATLFANGFNILLDALFIFGLGWGVSGAAWATVIAHVLELAWLARHWLASALPRVRLRSEQLHAVLQVGIPAGLQMGLEIGSFAILAGLIASMGETQMASHQIALQIIHFSFLPAWAISEACSVLCGQAVGAGRDDRIRPIARLGLWVAGAYTGLATGVLILGSRSIASCFSTDPMVITTATQLLWVAAGFQMADGAYMIARGTLRGAGDVKTPALIGIVTAWVCTPPLTWLLGIQLGLGALGGWLGLLLEIGVGGSLLWWRLERGHWKGAAERSRRLLRQKPGQHLTDTT